jgi:hypothetical protein
LAESMIDVIGTCAWVCEDEVCVERRSDGWARCFCNRGAACLLLAACSSTTTSASGLSRPPSSSVLRPARPTPSPAPQYPSSTNPRIEQSASSRSPQSQRFETPFTTTTSAESRAATQSPASGHPLHRTMLGPRD